MTFQGEVEVHLPRWLATKNSTSTLLRGRVQRDTDKAFHFKGRVVSRKSTVCLVCGRDLEHPVSRLLGIGPTCLDRLGIPSPDLDAVSEADVERLRQAIESSEFEGWLPRSLVSIQPVTQVR